MSSAAEAKDQESQENDPLLRADPPAKPNDAPPPPGGAGATMGELEKAYFRFFGMQAGGKPVLMSAALVTIAVLQWWFFNIAVIIINKWIFQEYKFTFPMTLTSIHFLVSWAGAHLCIKMLKLSPLIEVKPEDRLPRILPLAAVTCVNIVLGNVSLRYIPVSFVQTIKALTPATTVLLQVLVWGKKFHRLIYVSLLPVVGGMILASATELSFVMAGFVAALASCFITSTGVILAELLLSGKYKFDSINTVFHMVPYSFYLLVVPALAFEGRGVYLWMLETESAVVPLGAIVLSGVLAFGLNFSLYAVIKVTSAMTFTVVGNFKVAVAVLSSWLVFRNPMNVLNILGCGITIAGCTYYGFLQHHFSQLAKAAAAAAAAASGSSTGPAVTELALKSQPPAKNPGTQA